jgi:hypothetical protein
VAEVIHLKAGVAGEAGVAEGAEVAVVEVRSTKLMVRR